MKPFLLVVLLFPQQDLDPLIERLGADEVEVRQKAVEDIVRLGLDVLPRLRDRLARATDAEVRAQLKRAIEQLERLERVARFRPNLRQVTLKPDRRGLRDSLEAVATSASVPIQIQGELPGHVAIALDRVPFWEAIEKLRKDGRGFGYDVEGNLEDLRVIVREKRDRELPHAPAGPFLLQVKNVKVTRWLFDGTEPGWTQLDMAIHQLCGGRPFELRLRIKSIADDLGMEYAGRLKDPEKLYVSTSRMLQIPAVVPEKARRLTMRGELLATYPRDVRGLRIDEPARDLPKDVSGDEFKVRMSEVRETSKGIAIYFTLSIPGKKGSEVFDRSGNFFYVLMTKDKRRRGFNGFHTEGKEDAITVKLTTPGLRKDDIASFEVVELVDSEEITYPFVFDNITLE